MLDVFKQVLELAAWSAFGAACGVYSDTVSWYSVHFLPGPMSIFLQCLKDGGPSAATLLFVPSFFVGSKLRVIGLTGGIASGKSTATSCIRGLGVPVVDADEISHRILQKGKPAYWRVRNAFKKYSIVDADENIDRAALRTLVINNKALNKTLKKCTHSAIAWELLASVWFQSIVLRKAVVVLDAPLLFESKLNLLCKHVLLVHVPPNVQVARLQARDGKSAEECRKALEWQMPTEKKLAMSDLPIDNSGSKDELIRSVTAITRKLKEEARCHAIAPLLQ